MKILYIHVFVFSLCSVMNFAFQFVIHLFTPKCYQLTAAVNTFHKSQKITMTMNI